MQTHTLEPILAAHSFFSGFDRAHLTLLAGCASNVCVEAGQFFFREGEEANRFYVIRHGRVALETSVPGRDPLVIQTKQAGDILGWSWLIPPYCWTFDARAVEQTRAIMLDGECLRKKCEDDADLDRHLLKRVAQILVQELQATRHQLLDVYGTPSSKSATHD